MKRVCLILKRYNLNTKLMWLNSLNSYIMILNWISTQPTEFILFIYLFISWIIYRSQEPWDRNKNNTNQSWEVKSWEKWGYIKIQRKQLMAGRKNMKVLEKRQAVEQKWTMWACKNCKILHLFSPRRRVARPSWERREKTLTVSGRQNEREQKVKKKSDDHPSQSYRCQGTTSRWAGRRLAIPPSEVNPSESTYCVREYLCEVTCVPQHAMHRRVICK